MTTTKLVVYNFQDGQDIIPFVDLEFNGASHNVLVNATNEALKHVEENTSKGCIIEVALGGMFLIATSVPSGTPTDIH